VTEHGLFIEVLPETDKALVESRPLCNVICLCCYWLIAFTNTGTPINGTLAQTMSITLRPTWS